MAQQLAPRPAAVAPAPLLPLQGWDVAVTSARRGRDLTELLTQQGARVHHVPAVRTVADEDAQLGVTELALARAVDLVVATTGVGFSMWLDAADGWGVGDRLRSALSLARVYARGPKARGALSAAGLEDAAGHPCDSSWEVLEQLLALDLRGRRVVVQLHGAASDDFARILRTAGADVVEVPVYRSIAPEEGALDTLVKRLVARELHGVTFTSAAAATNVLDAATRAGLLDSLLDALSDGVHAGCVGPVAAAPLTRFSVPVILPAHPRLGALAHTLGEALGRTETRLVVAGHDLRVRGSAVLVDGDLRFLAPAPMALLSALARQPGRVLSPSALAAELPGDGENHTVEMTVSRLRAGLGDAQCVRNVVKRGYRLDVEGVDEVVPDDVEEEPAPPMLALVGGSGAVRVAVDLLYSRLLAEPLVRHYFEDVDMPRLKRHQVLLLSELLGGPVRYTGRELAAAHAGLGITSEQYRCVLDHLRAVLEELEVDREGVAAVTGMLRALERSVTAR